MQILFNFFGSVDLYMHQYSILLLIINNVITNFSPQEIRGVYLWIPFFLWERHPGRNINSDNLSYIRIWNHNNKLSSSIWAHLFLKGFTKECTQLLLFCDNPIAIFEPLALRLAICSVFLGYIFQNFSKP